MTNRRLVVMRHAKAEPYGAVDHERSLTSRGRSDATAAGRHLASIDVLPDYGLVSDAARTVQTWEHVLEGAQVDPPAEITHAMYVASADAVLEALRGLPEDARTVVYVGHNPTAEYLAGVLHDNEGDPVVLQGLLAGFPTAAFAVFEVEEWSGLAEGTARLTHFYAPR